MPYTEQAMKRISAHLLSRSTTKLSQCLSMTFTRVVQGALFGTILASGVAASDGSSPVTATLNLMLGMLLLIAAFKKWPREEDRDEPLLKWMQALDQTMALKASGMGASEQPVQAAPASAALRPGGCAGVAALAGMN